MSEWQDGNMGGIQPVELFASMLASLDDETSEVGVRPSPLSWGRRLVPSFPLSVNIMQDWLKSMPGL